MNSGHERATPHETLCSGCRCRPCRCVVTTAGNTVRTQCRNCATTPCACVEKPVDWTPMEQGVEPEPGDPPPRCTACDREILAEEVYTQHKSGTYCTKHFCHECNTPIGVDGGVGTGWGTWFGKNYCSSCLDKRSSLEPEQNTPDSCSDCGRDLLDLSAVEIGGKTFCLVCKPIGDAFSEAVELVKHDSTKPRYDLIPPEALDAIAQVLAEGAAKYEDRGWEKGGSWGKCFSSCMRHLWAWWRGERLDRESALPHLAHAACRVMFLLAYECRGVGEDDRSGGV